LFGILIKAFLRMFWKMEFATCTKKVLLLKPLRGFEAILRYLTSSEFWLFHLKIGEKIKTQGLDHFDTTHHRYLKTN